jgi:hypothetical protein
MNETRIRIDAVSDDDAADAKVVFRDCIRTAVSLAFDRPSGAAYRLLDRVDS